MSYRDAMSLFDGIVDLSREERAERMRGGDRKGEEGGNEGEEQEKQGPNFET